VVAPDGYFIFGELPKYLSIINRIFSKLKKPKKDWVFESTKSHKTFAQALMTVINIKKLLHTEPLAKLLKGEHDYTDLKINRINI